ncbi:MAG: hypothetical protein GF364_13550 [Candidatus Lokiarchaeota archaeon]|nr:hypothetical protein [Candidatus Lokiarchaeota archaeon]
MAQDIEQKIKKISQIFLEREDKLVKQQDLLNYIQDKDLFEHIISELLIRFEKIGYEIIKTKFLDETYYMLITDGIDDRLTPQMYGILALIVSLTKDLARNLTLEDAKKIFKPIWDELEYLIELNYLKEYRLKDVEYIIPTPLAKALFKNFIGDMTVKKILETFKNEK